MSNCLSEVLELQAARFKALGHPHRLQIFWRLANCCTAGVSSSTNQAVHRCVGDLAGELRIAPSTVSHHIKELTRAGLIATERAGREIRCWVEPDVLRELSEFFAGFMAEPAEVGGTAGCRDGCE